MAKILVIVERFYPEDFLVNDLVAAWKESGDEVEVLTQVPSYPYDKIYDGYENLKLQTTREFHDIPVHRVNTIFGYNTSVKKKVLNYLHFGWRTFWWCVRHGRKYDKVFVYHTAALTMAMGVWAMKLIWRKPITIWTQDLWPDAVYAYGFKPKWWKVAILNTFVRSIYGCCKRITVSCPSYVKRIKEICGREAEYVPQWDPTEMQVGVDEGVGVEGKKRVFMFAGNHGTPQDLPNVIEGFGKAGLKDAELWLVGGGVMLEPLKKLVEEKKVKGVVFQGRQPKAEMGKWFAKADALIISLIPEYRLTFPGKFQSYIKTGKPLFGILEGDARQMIEDEGLGVTADPMDVEAIAKAFRSFPFEKSEEIGARCLKLSNERFNREKLIKNLRGE